MLINFLVLKLQCAEFCTLEFCPWWKNTLKSRILLQTCRTFQYWPDSWKLTSVYYAWNKFLLQPQPVVNVFRGISNTNYSQVRSFKYYLGRLEPNALYCMETWRKEQTQRQRNVLTKTSGGCVIEKEITLSLTVNSIL